MKIILTITDSVLRKNLNIVRLVGIGVEYWSCVVVLHVLRNDMRHQGGITDDDGGEN